MRRSSIALVFALVVLATMAIPAIGAELHEPHRNTDLGCKASDEYAVWHFVNNQLRGEYENGWLVVQLGPNTYTAPLEATKGNRGTLHWWIAGPEAPDSIVSAVTYTSYAEALKGTNGDQLPGRLVISDAYCEKKDS